MTLCSTDPKVDSEDTAAPVGGISILSKGIASAGEFLGRLLLLLELTGLGSSLAFWRTVPLDLVR